MIAEAPNPVAYVEFIDDAAKRPRKALRSSILGHQETLEELGEVWEECRHAGWDGYGAVQVERESLSAAYKLIESLPPGFPRPSISAQPDGLLTFEWYRSPRRTLSISIDPLGVIYYAGLYGLDEHYGTVSYFDSLPDKILQLASEV